MKANEAIKIVINQVGNQRLLAEKLKVPRASVGHWAVGRRQVPAYLVMDIVKFSNGAIEAKDLRPDVFK